MNSLSSAFSEQALTACFNRNKSKFRRAGAAGIDGVGLVNFTDDLSESIKDIAKRVCARTYKHQALKAFSFQKDDGRFRWICVPTLRDRLVQRRMSEVIIATEGWKLQSKFGFGALKKIGAEAELTAIETARQLRADLPWVVKSDIASFFDQLPREDVRAAIRRVTRKRSLYPLLDMIIRTEAAANSHMKKQMAASGIIRGKGLRQGMPMSPLLSHVSLIEFDRFLEREDVKFVRYVDDLVFFGSSKSQAEEAFLKAKVWLRDQRSLSLPELGNGKSQLAFPNDGIEFLGIEIYKKAGANRLRIPDRKFKSLDSRFVDKTAVTFDDPEDGALLTALRFIGTARGSYKSVYGDLDNWKAFENQIRTNERRAIRQLAKKVAPLSRSSPGLSDAQLRAFGVKP